MLLIALAGAGQGMVNGGLVGSLEGLGCSLDVRMNDWRITEKIPGEALLKVPQEERDPRARLGSKECSLVKC